MCLCVSVCTILSIMIFLPQFYQCFMQWKAPNKLLYCIVNAKLFYIKLINNQTQKTRPISAMCHSTVDPFLALLSHY